MSAYAPNPSYAGNDEGYAPLTASLLARKGEAAPAVDATAHAGVDIDLIPSAAEAGGAKRAKAVRRRAQQRRAQEEKAGASRFSAANQDYAPPPSDPHAEDDDFPAAYAPNYAPNPGGETIVDAEPTPADPHDPAADNVERFPGAMRARAQEGGAWTISGPSIEDPFRVFPEGAPMDGAALEEVKARLRRRAKRAAASAGADRKATITFRMPARDLVRLRFASRELGVMCQSIILEALECYLEANDVAPVSDADLAAETDRLMRLKKEKARRRRG